MAVMRALLGALPPEEMRVSPLRSGRQGPQRVARRMESHGSLVISADECDLLRCLQAMKLDSESKKKPYSPPTFTVTRLTLAKANHFVACNGNCSDQEAADLLAPQGQELQQNDE
jgi:hypothetical protein